MKICFKCNENKPLSEFYKHAQMADGHLNKCKVCNKKDTKENIAKNHEYYLEYDKKRSNLPHRIKARELYSKTEAGIKAGEKAKLKWTENNSAKRAANVAIGSAVSNGKIIKPCSCSECNATDVRIHGHHDDYAYPLSVRWLCSKCHRLWHKENGSAINSLMTSTIETRESGFFIAD